MRFIFLLILIEPNGLVITPEPHPTQAECERRIVDTLASPPRNGYAMCVPEGSTTVIRTVGPTS